MYFILNYLIQNLVSFLAVLVISFCLTPKYPRLRIIISYSAVILVLYLFKFYSFGNQTALSIITLLTQVLMFTYTIALFTDSLYKRFIVFSIILLCNIIAESFGLIILENMASCSLALEPHSIEFTIALLLILPLLIFLYLLFLFIWKYFNQNKINIDGSLILHVARTHHFQSLKTPTKMAQTRSYD